MSHVIRFWPMELWAEKTVLFPDLPLKHLSLSSFSCLLDAENSESKVLEDGKASLLKEAGSVNKLIKQLFLP